MATNDKSSTMPAQSREAFTVREFAAAFRVSRATVYNLWRDGSGPAKMRVRGRTLISKEAADEWRRAMEAVAAGDAQ